MAKLLTRKNAASPSDFLNTVSNEVRRNDAFVLLEILRKVTGKDAVMWGSGIVGFDEYHYRYDSGHEGDMCMLGFSPRAGALSLYVLPGFAGQDELLARLGKHKKGKGCLYINKLADVDMDVLEAILRKAYRCMQQRYPAGG